MSIKYSVYIGLTFLGKFNTLEQVRSVLDTHNTSFVKPRIYRVTVTSQRVDLDGIEVKE